VKHAEFYSKNKFEKLVHLIVFIIRILGKHQGIYYVCACFVRLVARVLIVLILLNAWLIQWSVVFCYNLINNGCVCLWWRFNDTVFNRHLEI